MGLKSNIEWTGSTWNPITGCSKISVGCMNCYAERMAKRLKAMGQPNYIQGFQVKTHEHVLELPLKWKKPQTIFVNSMSDIFHKEVGVEFIFKTFQIMQRAYWHRFQVLTKRAERLRRMSPQISWTPNIWMGVTVESKEYTSRIEDLRNTQAYVKFLSLEPLLGPLSGLDLNGIDWVIVGGESGPGARAIKEEWVLEIRDQCVEANIPFFFKQWGGVNKKKNGRLLKGRIWNGVPQREELLV
ncbi:MAG: phage Gp37/Gp68 family protein [Candidatus Omnitrophota bacterium]